MKTKIFMILCSIFMLSSLANKASSNLTCDGNGGCWYTSYHYDAFGGIHYDSVEYVGYGCVGSWYTQIDFVVPSGPPVHPELSADNYNSLANFTKSGLASPTADQSSEFAAIVAAYPSSPAWANPLVLSADAYDAIYSGQPYYDIFYVYTSVDIATSAHMLNLYSDSPRTCTVVYKNVSGTTVATESIGVSKGSNYKLLTAAHSLPSGHYTLHVITSASDVSTALAI